MPSIKSVYDSPPPVPDGNIHHLLFNRPDQKEWPDYTLHINAVTGVKRTFREFLGRVYDGATGLDASVSQGGLGFEPEGEMVGILSENSKVRLQMPSSISSL